uniref:Uncharacterized protein n=1 Tax=Anguilla anguilla TaxID=7936 RepID=A0A0E9W3X0_ANGAN
MGVNKCIRIKTRASNISTDRKHIRIDRVFCTLYCSQDGCLTPQNMDTCA